MKKEILSIMTVKILLAVIIFAGMGTIIVGGGYIIGEYSKSETENKILKPVNQETKSCVEEGEKFYLKPGEPKEKKCCNDLKTGAVYSIIEDKCIPETVAFVCVNCPNYICGLGENRCNCPEDCDNKDKTIEVEIYFNNMKKYNGLSKEIGGKEVYEIYGIDDCGPIFPVTRVIPEPKNAIELTQSLLEELRKGPTKEEQLQGFISEDTFVKIINDFEIRGNSLLVNFNKQKLKDWEETISPRVLGSLASCEWSIYFSFINRTFEQIPEIKTIRIPANIFSEEDNTADWQTYRNEEFGFEVKYPKKWRPWFTQPDEFSPQGDWGEQIGELAIFSNQASDGSHCEFHLTTYSNPQNLSIRDFWKARLTNVYREGHLVSVYNFKSADDIQFGKNNEIFGVKFSMEREDWSSPNESMAIIAKKNDNIVELFWWGRDPYISTPECSKINLVLSTFRFLEDKDKEITIASPTEGDVWKIGETYQIRWTPKNPEGTAVIKLYKVPISSLSLKWEPSYPIPNTGSYSLMPFDSLEDGKYRFYIEGIKGKFSDEFSIVSK